MSASKATARGDGSAQPNRWSPGDVSKNQLSESPQCASDPQGGFVQFREKLWRVHEGNTDASPKSFTKGESVVLNALGNWFGLRNFQSSSEKPIHLAQSRFRQLEHQCEAAQLARDAAQLGRPFGRLGRSTAVAGVFRYVLEADLFSRAPIGSHGRRSTGSGAGNRHHSGEEHRQVKIRSGNWFVQRMAVADHPLANCRSISQT